MLQSDCLLAQRAATSGLDRLGYKQKAEIEAAAALATSNLRSIVFPIIGDPLAEFSARARTMLFLLFSA